MASVAMEQMSTLGSANHLKETIKTLPQDWSAFRSIASAQSLPEEQRQQLDKIDKGMTTMAVLMDKLLAAYGADDYAAVRP